MMHARLLQACYALLDALKHYHGSGTRIAHSTIRVLLAALTQHGAADGALLRLRAHSSTSAAFYSASCRVHRCQYNLLRISGQCMHCCR
jgi:hypothetical protein